MLAATALDSLIPMTDHTHGPANHGPLPDYLHGYSGYDQSGQDGSGFANHGHVSGATSSSYEEWHAPHQSDAHAQHAIFSGSHADPPPLNHTRHT